MHTLDFERITAEKLGGLAWVLDGSTGSTRRVGLERARRSRALRGELRAARLLSLRAADASTAGEPASAASAMAKLAGARLAQRRGRGGRPARPRGARRRGPTAPLEGGSAALYRASVGSTISGGTAEMQQLVIARRGLGLR